MKKSLIFHGGWAGHAPEVVSDFFANKLRNEGYEVDLTDSLDVLNDGESLKSYDLITPCWTMGEMTETHSANLRNAVSEGTGLGGFHGGMGDAFRGDVEYEWMVGGHFVAHPHVGEYEITVTNPSHPAVKALPDSFTYDSEQYYMLIDPGVEVLATTQYHYEGQEVTMPVIWTKQWGKGRVFFSALGHQPDEFTKYPAVAEMTLDGMKWATR